ncbi:hypothetical protein B0T16DRAFT_421489 [Cercophora newfieldiana]|uniref:Uncharacterized protein n=1 Tax=Cercophora newfieldiana TaxID=92897 RepID=A0AA40CIE8_9PEZI|nr:hypothetical protein B0T16DRAFT_421489 [Cercophora newfieldiana]
MGAKVTQPDGVEGETHAGSASRVSHKTSAATVAAPESATDNRASSDTGAVVSVPDARASCGDASVVGPADGHSDGTQLIRGLRSKIAKLEEQLAHSDNVLTTSEHTIAALRADRKVDQHAASLSDSGPRTRQRYGERLCQAPSLALLPCVLSTSPLLPCPSPECERVASSI